MDLFGVVNLKKLTPITVPLPPNVEERSPPVIAEAPTNHHVLGSRTETSLMSLSDPTDNSLLDGEEKQRSQTLKRKVVDENSGVGSSKKRSLILTGVKLPTGRGEGSSKIIRDDALAYDPTAIDNIATDTLVKKLEESAQQQSTLVGRL